MSAQCGGDILTSEKPSRITVTRFAGFMREPGIHLHNSRQTGWLRLSYCYGECVHPGLALVLFDTVVAAGDMPEQLAGSASGAEPDRFTSE
ncbi:hypothetical protein ACK6VM_18720 [Citrobacter meridianamericanus]